MSVPAVALPSGDKMPILGFGTFLASPGQAGEAVRTALKAGYRHIDCAKVYGNEAEIGAVFAEIFNDSESGIDRKDVFITSKLPPGNAAPKEVKETLQSTLADLKLEYLDLYLIHQPIPVRPNPDYDGKHRIIGKYLPRKGEGYGLQDVWRAMEQCQQAGLARNIGVSNYNTQSVNDLLNYARISPAMNQIERHPYHSNQQHVSFCLNNGLPVTAYAPLGAPGSYGKDKSDALLSNEVIVGVAAKYNKTAAQVLIRWSIDSGVVVIPKSVTPSRIVANFDVFDFSLSEDDMTAINALDKQGRMFMQDWMGVPTFF